MNWITNFLNFDHLALVLGALSGIARSPALYLAGALGCFTGLTSSLLITGLNRSRTGKLRTELETARQQLDDTDIRLAESLVSLNMLFNKVDQLSAQQGRIDSHSGKNGFKEAIALTQHGATTKQLVSTCGLSQGEARLVQVMYGTADTAVQPSVERALN